jgi:lipopolysaccharide export system protein LptA
MVVDNQARTAEFSGRVRAVQGTFEITSDTLKIDYRTSATSGSPLSESSESIERIVAQGKVKILMDGKVATTSQAEYTTATQVLVLSGTGSKITSDKNSIIGSKITFYRTDERVIVEGQADKRVEAEFFPKENK